jgi:hypothetical protein
MHSQDPSGEPPCLPLINKPLATPTPPPPSAHKPDKKKPRVMGFAMMGGSLLASGGSGKIVMNWPPRAAASAAFGPSAPLFGSFTSATNWITAPAPSERPPGARPCHLHQCQ